VRLLMVIVTIVFAVFIFACGNGQNVDGLCNQQGAVRYNSDHTSDICKYPDNDSTHLHWVRQ